MSTETATDTKKKAFTPAAELFLMQEVAKNAEMLFGKGTMSITNQAKHKCWQSIAAKLNINFTESIRTWDGCRKKYKNLVGSAKKKADALKHPKTGGGRKPPEPTAAEEVILQHLCGRPALEGLAGVDTAATNEEEADLNLAVQIDTDGTMFVDLGTDQAVPNPILAKCLQLSQESQNDESIENESPASVPTDIKHSINIQKTSKRKVSATDLNASWKQYLQASSRAAVTQEEYYLLKTKILRKEHNIPN